MGFSCEMWKFPRTHKKPSRRKEMAAIKTFLWSLGSDNIPLLFILLGVVMLAWVVFLGDIVIQAAA